LLPPALHAVTGSRPALWLHDGAPHAGHPHLAAALAAPLPAQRAESAPRGLLSMEILHTARACADNALHAVMGRMVDAAMRAARSLAAWL